jgi:poly(A) polymerase
MFSPKSKSDKPIQASIIAEASHGILQKHISKNALKVLNQLSDSGYEAFLVGGGVRDLMLGLRPKDFDIATNATPEQVRSLFRNSRIIGRRFRLVHVIFGREVLEVATFRSNQAQSQTDTNQKSSKSRQCPDSGMITRDNIFGRIDEDAIRRDFTVNAMYYNIVDNTVVDFLGGMEDLKNRQMKIIGDARERYREDPVRMLRAVRLSIKLGLTLSKETLQPIPEMANLLEPISNARLWDESLKLFLHGFANKTWDMLVETKLADCLFPQTIQSLKTSPDSFGHFLKQAFSSTDTRIKQNKPVTPAFLFAVWLWQPLLDKQQQYVNNGISPGESFNKAASNVLSNSHKRIGLPKRFSIAVREIWYLQNQLPKRFGKRAEKVFSHPRFRAAYDFLLLRAMPGSDEELLAQWWTDYQNVSPDQRLTMVKSLAKNRSRKSSAKRYPKKTKS